MLHCVLYVIALSLAILPHSSMGGRDGCTMSKQSRRSQEGILSNLNENHVILVGRYVSKENNIYSFKTVDLWGQYNGELGFMSDVDVTVDDIDASSVSDCFETLRPRERYYLILTKEATSGEFYASVPPVSVSKRNHKEKIWQRLCEISPENCVMYVYANTLPGMSGGRNTIEIRPGGNVVVQCKVHARHPLQKVTWYKDGKDIAEGGAVYGANGLRAYDTSMRTGTRDLYIFGANTMHNGQYKCVAEDANGGSSEFVTNIQLETSVQSPCPAEFKDYCMNGGTCKTVTVTPFSASCKCTNGYTGDRCQRTEINIFYTEKQLKDKQVHKLQSAVAALGVVVFACVVVGLILGAALLRTRRALGKKAALNSVDAEAAVKRNGSFFSKPQLLMDLQEGSDGKTMPSDRKASVCSQTTGQVRVSPRPRLKAAST